MGQTSSAENFETISSSGANLPTEITNVVVNIKYLATLTYDKVLQQVKELNDISKKAKDVDGKKLIFAVKKDTDTSLLWKGTIRIGCMKVSSETRQIESCRLLNLRQFSQVYRIILLHSSMRDSCKKCVEKTCTESSSNYEDGILAGVASCSGVDSDNTECNRLQAHLQMPDPYTSTSMILKGLEMDYCPGESLDECCICMERKPDVILPCAHSYCLPCIDQWNDNHDTCPICREEHTSDDSWVISEAPDSEEVQQEFQKAFRGLMD